MCPARGVWPVVDLAAFDDPAVPCDAEARRCRQGRRRRPATARAVPTPAKSSPIPAEDQGQQPQGGEAVDPCVVGGVGAVQHLDVVSLVVRRRVGPRRTAERPRRAVGRGELHHGVGGGPAVRAGSAGRAGVVVAPLQRHDGPLGPLRIREERDRHPGEVTETLSLEDHSSREPRAQRPVRQARASGPCVRDEPQGRADARWMSAVRPGARRCGNRACRAAAKARTRSPVSLVPTAWLGR